MRGTFVWWTALPMLLAAAAPASGQSTSTPPAESTPDAAIDFSADQVTYDSGGDVITASGEVRMSREGNYLAADQVVWNRKSGDVRAHGNVVVLTPQGDKIIGENVVLADTLRDGTIDNLLVVLESGGRIAAARGARAGEITTLESAIYSPCPVTTPSGCPRRPSWSIIRLLERAQLVEDVQAVDAAERPEVEQDHLAAQVREGEVPAAGVEPCPTSPAGELRRAHPRPPGGGRGHRLIVRHARDRRRGGGGSRFCIGTDFLVTSLDRYRWSIYCSGTDTYRTRSGKDHRHDHSAALHDHRRPPDRRARARQRPAARPGRPAPATRHPTGPTLRRTRTATATVRHRAAHRISPA